MNHYCTAFDSNYAQRGVALWLSLRRHDPGAVLWVLCLDETIAGTLRELGESGLRPIPLAELEAADPELPPARANRSRVEYIFTLSPCLPRYVLLQHPEVDVITYLDADTAFFSSPQPIFDALGTGNVLIVAHRFPAFLDDLNVRGRFNVGVLCFRNSAEGRRCLDDWRRRCIEWCHDRVEADRYADQKYLDAWPTAFAGVVECRHPGVNLAPWNWMNHRYTFAGGELRVDGQPLVIFHFAGFRPLGPSKAESGQLEYGIMPLRVRSWIYGRYWRLLQEAGEWLMRVGAAKPSTFYRQESRSAWKTRLLRLLFGSVWWRLGPWWISGRGGLGQASGRMVRRIRRALASEGRAS